MLSEQKIFFTPQKAVLRENQSVDLMNQLNNQYFNRFSSFSYMFI